MKNIIYFKLKTPKCRGEPLNQGSRGPSPPFSMENNIYNMNDFIIYLNIEIIPYK